MTRPAPRAGGTPSWAILVGLLGLGLAFRFLILLALPGSGFGVDISSFQYWASNLASEGLSGFYDRPFFHDYTPGYLYVLWVIGQIGNLFGGGPGDLIKIPPILCDIALGYLAWSMTRELGGSERSARIAAFIVVVNPVTWLDSALWGQVDSVGVVVLLLSLRELWRDRPERSAVLAMLAALIKPQLGILIPIVAAVTIRRALWPAGGYGDDDPASILGRGATAWERRVTGPIRILTTGLAGLLTAVVLSLPFGLSIPGLIAQLFKTAAGYPYLSVNAYNPWALVSQDGHGVAADRSWVCDSTVVPTGPSEFHLGPFTIPEWGSTGSTQVCADGFMVGPLPAVLVGMGLFLIVAVVVVWLVARRPDRRTMLVGLAVLSLAFFVLPTRVHERYLFPLVGVAAILAGVSLRWRLAYVISSAAMLANMYAVLTTLYSNNPGISDWLHVGDVVTSSTGVAVAALAQVAVFAWAGLQLRSGPLEDLQLDIESSAASGGSGLGGWLGLGGRAQPALAARDAGTGATHPAVPWDAPAPGGMAVAAEAEAGLVPVWDDRERGGEGPWAWVRARFNDRPIRADLSATLAKERGGRLDKLDLWLILVLVASIGTIRIWRLAEPYQMHFDEVYHPRTAMEFLQLWRYGISHDIYEWTHPHMAKYAMALGLEAFGEDEVTATNDLGITGITAAEVEPRWDDGGSHARSGDRLWVAGTDQVRAYDLSTRQVVATWPVPGVTTVAVDNAGHRVFVGTAAGDIDSIDTLGLDALRATNTPAEVPDASGAPAPTIAAASWLNAGGAIDALHPTGDGLALEVVAGDPTAASLITYDASAEHETARFDVAGVKGIVDHGASQVAVADSKGVELVDTTTGRSTATVQLDGPVQGITATSGLNQDPLYATYLGSGGPMIASIATGSDSGGSPQKTTFQLPGDSVGAIAYDQASMMLHVLGTSPAGVDRGTGSRATVYVVDPNGSNPVSNAVYEDAPLPFDAAALAMDANDQYPSSDREELVAISASGEMATIPVGQHAFAWRLPGVIAGLLMAVFIYILTRLLFRRREVAVLAGFLVAVDGMLFVQSRIGMNDAYVGVGIMAAYCLFAWLWLRPGNSRRHWVAWALGMPLLGVVLGLALASKWVAAYAIGGLGILVLARSALGRLILVLGMIGATAFLGYIAIAVPEGKAGGNYAFLAIMIALTVLAVVVSILHPVAWTWEEQRLAIFGPPVIGVLAVLAALALGKQDAAYGIGSLKATPLELGFAAILFGAAMYTAFVLAARIGFGPMALPPDPDDPAAVLGPPAAAPRGWLNLGAGFGIPAFWTLACLVAIPVVVYVTSYIPWSFVGQNQLLPEIWPGWPNGHTGQTLIQLTQQMYNYHNDLTSPHPASSPWWAWPLDLKPVWFYQDSFAGDTSASIYNAGNLVAWWLAIPAMGFLALQAYKRRNIALGLVGVGFAAQWLSWARIDRASFQYHYYTEIPFLLIALAYLIAELWHGPSWRTWVMVRLAAAVAVLGPFLLWLFQRPLCGIAQVTAINPGSTACPTTIPDVALSPRAIGIAIVVGIGVLLLLRLFLSSDSDDDGWYEADAGGGATWSAGIGGAGLRGRVVRAGAIAVSVVVGFSAITWLVPATSVIRLRAVPVEPIALIVTIALLPLAAFIATARDARRFAVGLLIAIGLWFVLWYPNISALPLPSNLTNMFQGLLPSYLYPFQFWVNTTPRPTGPMQLSWVAILGVMVAGLAVAVAYSAWSWRMALAERRAEGLALGAAPGAAGAAGIAGPEPSLDEPKASGRR
ncbi:MAG TPA: phospholipid carrier-dependent glycosyltransferase [Candidatus Limnocylindrales bacterium]